MKSKLNYLIGISLGRKIKTKWFLFANIILAIIIMGIINIDSIISLFGGDFNQKQEIYVIDNTGVAYDVFKEQLNNISLNLNVEDTNGSNYKLEKYDKSIEESKKMLEKKDSALVVVFNNDIQNVINVEIISKEYIDLVEIQSITGAINNTKVALAILNSNISMEEINNIYAPIEIERTFLNEKMNSEDENMEIIVTTVFPIIILPFFMLTIFLVQMIGAEVNDEKATRGMEIIISNVSPKTHFFSKVIAGNLFVIMQGALLIVYAGIGLFIRKLIGGSSIVGGLGNEVSNILNSVMNSGFGEKLIYILPLTLILMLLTFLAYSLLAGILASMTTNTEDFQQLQTPIMIISLIGYYLAMMAGVFKGSLFIKIISFIPFISAILSPSLLVLSQIGIIEIMISIILTIITIWVLIKYGLKIYKVGILNYSSKDLWKKMWKAIKD
ncbi:MAG: ABC transporter permease [Firmicutes bacterium]|nr:ABC transporter permease [Bacillota bacterium]